MESNHDFINKLYIDPIESIKLNRKVLKRYHIKDRKRNENDFVAENLPNLHNSITGNLIMQNWNTKNNIPNDIGSCLNYPIIFDRKKFFHSQNSNILTLPSVRTKMDFSKEHIKEKSKQFLLYTEPSQIPTGAYSRYLTTDAGSSTPQEDHKNYLGMKRKLLSSFSHSQQVTEENSNYNSRRQQLVPIEHFNENQQIVIAQTQDNSSRLNTVASTKPNKKKDLIDFSTFTKHLYLRDNDFLYAKRVGGPIDFMLCHYKHIKLPSKITSSCRNPQPRTVEYITMSKNTVTHTQKGATQVYSVQEWIDNYNKYKKLMDISLFRNFKTAKLFDLWRHFFKKTKKNFYTEKLKKKFHHIDEHLLAGIFEVRKILGKMKYTNIFEMDSFAPQLVNHFKEDHRNKLILINKIIENYRYEVKEVMKTACNNSYRAYKKSKRITLDDNADTDAKTNDDNNQKKHQDDSGNVQNFLKDAIPYAQDATRKTHYKKILRYIRGMDFLFNEAKFKVVEFSLDLLQKKFNRHYDAYLNHWTDAPLITTVILCLQGEVFYNPQIQTLKEVIFENFIQEKIYTVIYKKNFLEPQEFPTFMSCFDEVFECTVDQNTNLNNRLRDSSVIQEKYSIIKSFFDKCHQALEENTLILRPTLTNYDNYSKIDFHDLEINSTPSQLKDLLDKFLSEAQTIKKLKSKINIGIFEFDITYMIDMIIDAPRAWLQKLRAVIPKVLVTKLTKMIEKLNVFLRNLSVNPVDVESFIRLKKAVEDCTKQRQATEDENNDITDLITIVTNDKEIKLLDYDMKLLIEVKTCNVHYERKYDSMTYFIDNNIKNFRNDLKNQIKKFDADIKGMISELNTDTLNNYTEETFAPISFLEDKYIQISKAIFMKKSYQTLEDDLEIDQYDRSNFENLDNLKYDYDLKVQMWNSVKDFQDMTRMWDGTQVLQINIPSSTKYVDQWIELCNVGIVDLDFPNVPKEFLKHVNVYKEILPVLIAIQNKNVNEIDNLLMILKELLGISYDLNNVMFTLGKLLELPKVSFNKLKIIELNNQGNEEKRIKDMATALSNVFYPKRIPLKLNAQLGEKADKFYISEHDSDIEYEFIENNLMTISKIFLCPYCAVIKDRLLKLNMDFVKYRNFLDAYCNYQRYLEKSDSLINNGEFAKEMPADYKKLQSESSVKSLFKILKDNLFIGRFLENSNDKVMTLIGNIVQNFELNYKTISLYLDKKRREFPKFFLLNDDEMSMLYSFKETNEFKEMLLRKLFPFIAEINLGNENDEYISITTSDEEKFQIKNTKGSKLIKDYIDLIENGINKKIKDAFKGFKKEYEASLRPKSSKKPKEVIFDLLNIIDKDKDKDKENITINYAQTILNSLHSCMVDLLEKALVTEENSFDRLFDLYNESKDDRRFKFISMLKEPNTPFLLRRILINLISLENYYITIIETLIREDVTRTTDYYFQRLITTKLENDNYTIKVLNITLDYGFEYVGIQNNFVIIPETERMFLTFANCIHLHQPFMSYGIAESGKKETCQIIAGFFGKRITYVNTTKEFSVEGFNNVLYGNLKSGGWICLDKVENISYELLAALSLRIIEVMRLLKANEEEGCLCEGGEKYLVNYKTLNIFMMRNINTTQGTTNDIPIVIKDYYRMVSFNLIDYQHYITLTLMNLGFEELSIPLARKIIFIIKLLCHKILAAKGKLLPSVLFKRLHKAIIPKVHLITQSNAVDILCESFHKAVDYILIQTELDDFTKYTNDILRITEEPKIQQQQHLQSSSFPPADTTVIDIEPINDIDHCISSLLTQFKFNNNQYETKIRNMYNSLDQFHSFLLLGPSLSGKSEALILLRQITQSMNLINPQKYPILHSVVIFPKSKNQSELFALNKVETAHQFNNNYLDNMIDLFKPDNYKELEELNQHIIMMATTLQGKNKIKTAQSTMSLAMSPTRLQSRCNPKMRHDEENDDEYQENNPNDNNNESTHNIIPSITFDGHIDITWIDYINSIYDQQHSITRPNGRKLPMNTWKLFFEANSVKQASPSFITRQYIISFNYDHFSWENILYSWVESNPKININDSLKNYIRGLFENFFPKVWDFITNNTLKCIPLTESYTLKNLINLFDSILPIFNFEDKIIGRRQFNVLPKIEIIKQSALSMFILSCAWTMLFFSNFVIKTKIEKLISDIFKADDLKGPIFEYFISDTTNDYEEWKVMLEQHSEFKEPENDPNSLFLYDQIFIHSNETIAYWWLCRKLINADYNFYMHGKPSGGKTFLLNSLLKFYEDTTIDLKTIKTLITGNTSSNQLENFIQNNTQQIKRNQLGDQFGRKIVMFIDDVHLASNDSFNQGQSEVKEYLRKITQTMHLYDSKRNLIKYLEKFSIAACGNLSSYPLNQDDDRFLSKFTLVTHYLSEGTYVNFYKTTLEYHLRKVIPNTSSITATQYIQASIKLNEMLKENISYEPNKLHVDFTMRDVTRVIQSFHLFNFKGNNPSDYPELLKKLFFYVSTRVYEDMLTNDKDVMKFRKCICDAYSSAFKQDKTTPEIVYGKWDMIESYVFQRNYHYDSSKDIDNMTKPSTDSIEPNTNEKTSSSALPTIAAVKPIIPLIPKEPDQIFYESKASLYDFIQEKLNHFYTTEGIKNTNWILLTEYNLLFILKILRILESPKRDLIIIGKEYTGKESLFKFAAFIIGYDVIEVDEMLLKKSHEVFNKDFTINRVLMNCTYNNRKTILFAQSKALNSNWILETCTFLLNPNEIKNNYSFINDHSYGDLDENTLMQRIKTNLSICLDIEENTILYRHINIYYPSIVKLSNCIYQKNLNESLMSSLIITELQSIVLESYSSKSLGKLFIDIHSYSKDLGKEYSNKLGLKIKVTQKHFERMIRFYHIKYNEYKTILQSKEKTFIEALETINRCEATMNQLTKEIDDLQPDKNDTEKQIEECKKEIGQKSSEKSQWKIKRIEEEKPINGLEGDKTEKELMLQGIFAPFKETLDKAALVLGRVSSGDVTEIKNTWDSLTFGKFILGKIFELLGDNNNDWDYIKKVLDVKMIKSFHAISPLKESKELIRITNEIVASPEFTSGDKYQKPFKTCGVLCDYFYACSKYFNEIDNQRATLDEISDIKEKISAINKKVREYLTIIKEIENAITGIEKTIDQLDKKKSNLVSQIEKKENLRQVLNDFNTITKEKKIIFLNKKEHVSSILKHFEFYLMYMSAYTIYAPPFDKGSRMKMHGYLYSLAQAMGIQIEKELEEADNDEGEQEESKPLQVPNAITSNTDIMLKEYHLSELLTALLDSSGSDKDFLTSINNFEEFYKENFMIMQLFKTKVPYIIDSNHFSKTILSSFIQYKEMTPIIISDFNAIDFIEKIDSALKNGSVLFIENCDETTYARMRNFIIQNEVLNDKGKKTIEIDGIIKEKTEKFQLYLLKTKCDSAIHSKAWADALVINFNCTSEMISSQLFKFLSMEQDPRTYGLYTKVKNDISKDINKVLELEKKLLISINQIDLTGNVDKLSFNTSLLDHYRLENQTYSLNQSSLEGNKARYMALNGDLQRFKLYASDTAKLYKIMAKMFPLEPLYAFSLEFFSTITRRFFKENYGLYKEQIGIAATEESNKDRNKDRDDDDEDNDKGNEDNDEDESPKKRKPVKSVMIPTYEKEALLKLIIYIYEKMIHLYSIDKRSNLLLLFLFFFLKEKDEIPSNYKMIINNVKLIYFDNGLDINNFNEQSPIKCITKFKWNCLKQINDTSAYVFSIILDHMENHAAEWEKYLSKYNNTSTTDQVNYISNNFALFSEELESSINPLLKFILFTILHPENSVALINTTIQSILQENLTIPVYSLHSEMTTPKVKALPNTNENNEDNKDNNRNNQDQNNNNPNKALNSPLLIITSNYEESIFQELQDIYYPLLLQESSNSIDLQYKEIIPKGELSVAELELLHQGMKTGGMFIIKNAHIPKDTLNKLCDEIKETQASISESFKLILIETNKHLLANSLYDNCTIINRDINLFTNMKEYIIDLVLNMPFEYMASFVNRKGCNFIYTRKILIGFIIAAGVVMQLEFYHSGLLMIPIEFKRNDFYLVMQFITEYLNSCNDDKMAQMSNAENILGFNFTSLLSIAIEQFYTNRLIYKEDIVRLERLAMKIFDEENMLNEQCYFIYGKFTIKAKGSEMEMTKDDFINIFKEIPQTDYYKLNPHISMQLIDDSLKETLHSFYSFTYMISNGGSNSNSNSNSNNITTKMNKIPKVNIEAIRKQMLNLKGKLPDLISLNEAHPQLFKISKSNDYVNPLDSLLKIEMEEFNEYITMITNDINAIIEIIKGNMIYVEQYSAMINEFSKQKDTVPSKWKTIQWIRHHTSTQAPNKDLTLIQLLNIITHHYQTITQWIRNATLKVFPLNQFNNIKLFFDCLPFYFIKSHPELTAEQIRLKFFITNAKTRKELSEKDVSDYKTTYGKEVIFCKGIEIINGCFNDKGVLTYSEGEGCDEEIQLPIFGVTYVIDVHKKKRMNDEDDEEEDDDEEEEDKENKEQGEGEGEAQLQAQLITERSNDEEYNMINIPFYDRNDVKSFEIKEAFGIFELKYNIKDEIIHFKGVKISIGNNEEEKKEFASDEELIEDTTTAPLLNVKSD